jgi:hypothetical protein
MPAEETAAELWGDSPVAAVFALLSLVAVGILAFGAGHVLAPHVWHGNPAGFGAVRAALSLGIAFVAGPSIILLLSSAFRRLVEACRCD